VILSQALIGSIECRESTQETLISENSVFIQTNSCGTFLWILMPVSATLASQDLLRPSPKSPHRVTSSQLVRGVYLHPRGSSQLPSVQVQFHGSPATPSGHWEKGHAHKWWLPLHQGLGMNSDSVVVSDGQEGEQGFGLWPEFICPVVTSPLLLSALSP
jgi:hypothetical protein